MALSVASASALSMFSGRLAAGARRWAIRSQTGTPTTRRDDSWIAFSGCFGRQALWARARNQPPTPWTDAPGSSVLVSGCPLTGGGLPKSAASSGDLWAPRVSPLWRRRTPEFGVPLAQAHSRLRFERVARGVGRTSRSERRAWVLRSSGLGQSTGSKTKQGTPQQKPEGTTVLHVVVGVVLADLGSEGHVV